MKHQLSAAQTKSSKPYNIRERSMLFACDVVRIAQELQQRGRIASELSIQLVNAAVNAASNLEEADDGSSPRDFRAKERISLRELKESRLRLRILRQTGYLKEKDDCTPAKNPEPDWDLEFGIWDLGFGIWDLGFYWVSPVTRGAFPRAGPGDTSNEKRSAGIRLPGWSSA
jgi:four helix bundle protein